MELLKNILKSSNKFLQHKRRNVPQLVLLKCTVPYSVGLLNLVEPPDLPTAGYLNIPYGYLNLQYLKDTCTKFRIPGSSTRTKPVNSGT